MPPQPENASRRPLFLLAAGTLAGIAIAAAGLLSTAADEAILPASAVARVNGHTIQRADYERLLTALTQDKRNPVEANHETFVLDRLIEEELLIQRGLELGLAHHDTRVRKDLTMAMVDSVIAGYRDVDTDDATLRSFFEENQSFFMQAGRFRVRQIWAHARTMADGDIAYERAREATDRLRSGESFDAVKAELGDAERPPLPGTLLPPNKLTEYLGPTVARSIFDLEVGAISEPIRSSTGFHVVQVLERAATAIPEFDTVRTQVLHEYRRRQADQALRSYLDDLRARADVEIAADLVGSTPP